MVGEDHLTKNGPERLVEPGAQIRDSLGGRVEIARVGIGGPGHAEQDTREAPVRSLAGPPDRQGVGILAPAQRPPRALFRQPGSDRQPELMRDVGGRAVVRYKPLGTKCADCHDPRVLRERPRAEQNELPDARVPFGESVLRWRGGDL